MQVASLKQMSQDAPERFAGVASALMPRPRGDSHLDLPRVIKRAMQSAITDQFAGVSLDQRQLEPSARHAELRLTLAVDQTGRVFGSE